MTCEGVAMRARTLSVLLLVTVVLAGLVAALRPGPAAAEPSIAPFRGLGTWVDVYDYGPRFQGDGGPPAVLPASVDDMARLGVRTLYLQAAQDDTRSEGVIVDRELVGRFLRQAHERGIRVVAWYLPHFADVERDLRHIRALAQFRSGGQRFDGIALDIEWTNDVEDVSRRNDALREISRRSREIVGDATPLGAIVLEPVLIEDVNRAYWPDFPWKQLKPYYDVWLPMSYWTNRSSGSEWADSFRYTSENIRRVRRNLDDRDAAVHTIGGIADSAGPGDWEGFVRGAERQDAIGWSVYDYVTLSSASWPRLRGL
jgi:hypothetical protein